MASSAVSRLTNLRRHLDLPDTINKQRSNMGLILAAGVNTIGGSIMVKVASEVSEALSLGRAVVALESTIISHGMPYPQNLETIKEVEAIVRENGAVPATIAILDGTPCVAMDISSDLTELGRTPVVVICAGVKSILDIPRTLEYLETQGVCVAAYKTNEFPAFFTESSGCKVSCRVDTPEDCARLIEANIKLNLGTGILIAVPIPREHSTSGLIIESALQKALKEARENNITGNAETPFLLARVNDLTGGASLASNIALVKNNALVGAKVAAALAQLRDHCQR